MFKSAVSNFPMRIENALIYIYIFFLLIFTVNESLSYCIYFLWIT